MSPQQLVVRIGARVIAADGSIGRLHCVLFDRESWHATALVVRRGILRKQHLLVPIEAVAQATDGLIRLKSRFEGLRPPGRRDEQLVGATRHDGHSERRTIWAWPAPWRRPGPDCAGVSGIAAGQPVRFLEGNAGRVEVLLLDGATRRLRSIVVRWRDRRVLVRAAWIAAFEPNDLALNATWTAIAQLPDYRPDREIQRELQTLLWRDRAIRAIAGGKTIRTDVRDGVVTIRGYTPYAIQRRWAEGLVRQVPGVLGIHNALVVDGDLEVAVAQAISREPRLADLRISVRSDLGRVSLDGDVPSATLRARAEEVAYSVPDVRALVNRLTVNGRPMLPARVPPEVRVGWAIYDLNLDHRLGDVERVVVSPRLRRVTALVARLANEETGRGATSDWLVSQPKQRRRVLIPIESVRRANARGVFLALTAEEVATLEDFDPAAYQAPPATWEAPFPYRASDVVLESGGAAGASVPTVDRKGVEAGQDGEMTALRSTMAERPARRSPSEHVPVAAKSRSIPATLRSE